MYFFDNPHDLRPLNPDDDNRLTLLANSLKQFVGSLRNYDEFCFRELFRLACDRQGLAAIESALTEAGVEHFSNLGRIEASKDVISRYGIWRKHATTVYLASGSREINYVPLPKKLPPDACYVAVEVTKFNRSK